VSTFLQLVNLVRSEAGITGGDLTTVQSGLSAESQRIANWVNNEWLRIQRKKPDWQWMRQYFTCPLTGGTQEYTPTQIGAVSTPTFTAAQFGNWKRDSFRIYTNATPTQIDEQLATFIPWDQFRNIYLYGSMRQNFSRPVAFTVSPKKNLLFGMPPDVNATVSYFFDGEMYLAPSALVLDADTPGAPAFYHDWIMARALKAYGVFMAAGEVIQRAQELINEIQPQISVDQLPVIECGPPLA
jgi:hypothetical protein